MSKMKLPTFVVLSALFCLGHSQESTEYLDVTSSMSSFQAQYKYEPNIVTIRNQIYTVYLKKQYSYSGDGDSAELIVTSLDSGNRRQQIKSCQLSTLRLDSFTGIEVKKVVALGNGKIVIVTNTQMSSEKTWVYHIIIDPLDCSSEKTFKFPFTIDGQAVLALIPYHDSYDIFYTYYKTSSTGLPKNPYRYNDQGQRINLDYSLETPSNYYFKFQINTIKPFDASEGYYHSYFDKPNREMVLQRLDSRFQKVKELRLKDSPWDTANDVSTSQGHISYCQLKIENPFCKLLNADLEVQVTSKLPKLNFPKGGQVDDRQVINLPQKGLVVFISYEHPSVDSEDFLRNPYDFYLLWVGSDGSVGKTKKIGSASLRSKKDYKVVDSSKDFCHVTVSNASYRDVTVYNRCLDL